MFFSMDGIHLPAVCVCKNSKICTAMQMACSIHREYMRMQYDVDSSCAIYLAKIGQKAHLYHLSQHITEHPQKAIVALDFFCSI